jgi:iron(III) transport system ATP-binding protein
LATECHGPVDVLVRPEQLVLTPTGAAPAEAGATVELVEYYGHDAVVVLRLDGGAVIKARVVQPGAQRGDRVELQYGGPPAVAYPCTAEPVRPVPSAVG